ncbi:MAG TPA: hypothetical protein VFK15_16500 [Burkholderiales bacterium]|nr:hypothetical protein [Burkholderiales bacterium]
MRGIALFPITAPSAPLGCIAFMKAAFGLRFAPLFFFAAVFLDFFFAAIDDLPLVVRC